MIHTTRRHSPYHQKMQYDSISRCIFQCTLPEINPPRFRQTLFLGIDNVTFGDIRLKGHGRVSNKGHSVVQTPRPSLCNRGSKSKSSFIT